MGEGLGVAREGKRTFIFFGRPNPKATEKSKVNILRTNGRGGERKEIISMDQDSLGIEKQSC